MVHSCEEAQQLQTEIIQKLLSFHGFKYLFHQELMVLYFFSGFFYFRSDQYYSNDY